MSTNSHTPENHLHAIDTSIAELKDLERRTIAPASIPHQFIGTMVDNTMVLLTTPANILDQGGRSFSCTGFETWISLMQAVHRSFYSSILLATERALKFICDEQNLEVNSRRKLKHDVLLDIIQANIQNSPAASKAVAELKKQNKHNRPDFSDYLECALDATNLDKETIVKWRKFFRALSIARNKASHSNTALTEAEKADLRDGGFALLISDTGIFVTNPRNYAQASILVLDFFDELQKGRH
ncbi:HEPN_RiboL-PSP domain-containing protein [Pseudomonas sp. IT-P74]|uniref:hypothetical protein n=1 Tax=Pseudomonas sp. IT-P74 TaxID=3026445 RepID=UPI0039DF89FB